MTSSDTAARVDTLRQQLGSAEGENQEDLTFALEEAEFALENALEALDEPVYAPPLMDVWFKNAEQGWASGGYGTLLRTQNGGRQWDDWAHQLDNEDELHLNGVTGGPENSLFLASEWGYVFRSTNGGNTWELMETGYDGSFFGVVVNPDRKSVV